MITAHYVEIRSRKLPGQPTETIIREVHSKNGHGRKTVRILRGNRAVSTVSEPLTHTENTNIQVRKFTPNLYTSAENRTSQSLSPSPITPEPPTKKPKNPKKTKTKKARKAPATKKTKSRKASQA